MTRKTEIRRRDWTAEEVRALGIRTDIATAGSIVGIGRSLSYKLANEGQFPVKVVRVGNRFVVPVRGLLELLDVPEAA